MAFMTDTASVSSFLSGRLALPVVRVRIRLIQPGRVCLREHSKTRPAKIRKELPL